MDSCKFRNASNDSRNKLFAIFFILFFIAIPINVMFNLFLSSTWKWKLAYLISVTVFDTSVSICCIPILWIWGKCKRINWVRKSKRKTWIILCETIIRSIFDLSDKINKHISFFSTLHLLQYSCTLKVACPLSNSVSGVLCSLWN